ncbi:hypothetical protein WDZ92_39535, partial [Nostoc sp. NIES-2111]
MHPSAFSAANEQAEVGALAAASLGLDDKLRTYIAQFRKAHARLMQAAGDIVAAESPELKAAILEKQRNLLFQQVAHQLDLIVDHAGPINAQLKAAEANALDAMNAAVRTGLAAAAEVRTVAEESLHDNTKAAERSRSTSGLISLGAVVFALLMAFAVAFVLARSLSRPIVRMVAAIRSLASGHRTAAVPDQARPEERGA